MDLERRCVHNVSHHEGGVYVGAGRCVAREEGEETKECGCKIE